VAGRRETATDLVPDESRSDTFSADFGSDGSASDSDVDLVSHHGGSDADAVDQREEKRGVEGVVEPVGGMTGKRSRTADNRSADERQCSHRYGVQPHLRHEVVAAQDREAEYVAMEPKLTEMGLRIMEQQQGRFRGPGYWQAWRPGRLDFAQRTWFQVWDQKRPEMSRSASDVTFRLLYMMWAALQTVFKRLPCQNQRTRDVKAFRKYGMHKRIYLRLRELGGLETTIDETGVENTLLHYDAVKTVVREEFSYLTGEMRVRDGNRKHEYRLVVGWQHVMKFRDDWEKERLVLCVLSAYMVTEDLDAEQGRAVLAQRHCDWPAWPARW
jgi:hypothetical protein